MAMSVSRPPLSRVEFEERWLEVALAEHGLRVLGLYVPTMIGGLGKAAFWEAMHRHVLHRWWPDVEDF